MRLRKSWVVTLSSVLIVAGLLIWRSDESGSVPVDQVTRAPAPPSIAPHRAALKQVPLPTQVDEPPLTERIERLIATHDPAKAFDAYRLLRDCAAFNKDHDRLTFDLAELKNRKPDSLPGFRGMTASEKQHDIKLCGGMTERERLSRLDYLAIAAKAGIAGAAEAFAEEGPFGDRSALQTRPSDPLVQEWRAQAITQLISAGERTGELGALALLMIEYQDGSYLTEKNLLLAYRYGVAMGLILRDIKGGDNPLSQQFAPDSTIMTPWTSGSSPEELAAQFAEAKRIAENARAMRKRARAGTLPNVS